MTDTTALRAGLLRTFCPDPERHGQYCLCGVDHPVALSLLGQIDTLSEKLANVRQVRDQTIDLAQTYLDRATAAEARCDTLTKERDEAQEDMAEAQADTKEFARAGHAERARAVAAEARCATLEEALRGVRDDLHNENRLNTLSIVCTVWHSEIETTVDFIDAALSPNSIPDDVGK